MSINFKYRKEAKNFTDGKDWTVYPLGVRCYYKDLPLFRYIKNRINKYWTYLIIWSGMFDLKCKYLQYRAQGKIT